MAGTVMHRTEGSGGLCARTLWLLVKMRGWREMKGEDKLLLPSVYLEGNWSQNLLRPHLHVTNAIGPALDEGRTSPGTNARDLGTQEDIESHLLLVQANPPWLCTWQPLVYWCATHVADLSEGDRISLDIAA